MIIITITPVEIIVKALQMGIETNIITYSRNDHSEYTDIDAKRFYIKKHTRDGKKKVFECYHPMVISKGIER